MKMVSFRDRIEKIIETSFEPVCAYDDELWWDCGPDSIPDIGEDDDGDPCMVVNQAWSVQIMVSNPKEELRANVFIAFTVSSVSDIDDVAERIRDVASDMAFQRQVYDVKIDD